MTENKDQNSNNDTRNESILDFLKVTMKEIFKQKKFYLLPIWALIAAVGIIILLVGGNQILPAIYMGF